MPLMIFLIEIMQKFKQQKQTKFHANKKKAPEKESFSRINPYPKYDW